ncbi:MAG: SDR family NAD(P)-dependent oxidoreductase [Acidimicrobiia bacterium]
MTGRLEGKVAVVTGAGSGIGKATALRFAHEGASVVVQDLRGDAAQTTVDEITAAGGKAMAWGSDVSDSAAIAAMFDASTAQLGVADVLFSGAGVDRTPGDGSNAGGLSQGIQVVDMTDEGWQRMLDIHLNGAFYCTRELVKRLAPTGKPASIIVVSSIAGTSGWGAVHYATAKAGLLGFIRSMARMTGPLGIRANAICPGVIDTPMVAGVDKGAIEGLKMLTPLGKVGSADDIAHLAVYLASDESGFVTGQAISPNGGLVIA